MREGGLFSEELLDGCEFRFGHVQIFLRTLGVMLLHGGLGFGDVGLHVLLGSDDVAAKAIACGSLLALNIVQGLRDGGGAAVDVVVAVLVILDGRGFVGFSLGIRL